MQNSETGKAINPYDNETVNPKAKPLTEGETIFNSLSRLSGRANKRHTVGFAPEDLPPPKELGDSEGTKSEE